jgi:ABC-2 type transport system permease protein
LRNVFTIAGRELRSLFTSPVAFVVLAGFLLLGGWFFYNLLARFSMLVSLYSSTQMGGGDAGLNLNEIVIAPLLHNLAIILVILVPMITMRSFAEERRTGTMELLLTSPISTAQLVLGKFLGIACFVSLMVATTMVYGLILSLYGNPEIPVMLAGYAGLLLLAFTLVAIGLFASSLTENQIIAAVTGLVAMLLLFIIAWPANAAGDVLGPVLEYLSVMEHFDTMVRGILSSSDLIYFTSMIAGWIFLTQRSIESLRWR